MTTPDSATSGLPKSLQSARPDIAVTLSHCLCGGAPARMGAEIRRVVCQKCLAQTPWLGTIKLADAAWNRMMAVPSGISTPTGSEDWLKQFCGQQQADTEARTLLSALADELTKPSSVRVEHDIGAAIRAVLARKE